MVIRNLIKIAIAAGEAVGKAFSRAVKEELNGKFDISIKSIYVF
jgi:hypothetical protein